MAEPKRLFEHGYYGPTTLDLLCVPSIDEACLVMNFAEGYKEESVNKLVSEGVKINREFVKAQDPIVIRKVPEACTYEEYSRITKTEAPWRNPTVYEASVVLFLLEAVRKSNYTDKDFLEKFYDHTAFWTQPAVVDGKPELTAIVREVDPVTSVASIFPFFGREKHQAAGYDSARILVLDKYK